MKNEAAPAIACSDWLSAMSEETDKEIGRWQEAIREQLCKACPEANIDGAGSDTGDPLDLTQAEIGQALAHLQNKIDNLKAEIRHPNLGF